jgi:hypothetical protein
MKVEDLTFVVLKEHIDRFSIDKRIREYYPEAKICVIPQVLNGAVLTCMEGIKTIWDDLPVLFNDCDHAFLCDSFYKYCGKAEFDQPDGALLTFFADSPNYSYVRFDGCGKVIGTIEKSVVSHEAICGAYYFRNRSIFEKAAEQYLTRCAYKEFFMSGVYNEMADRNQSIDTFSLDAHISFGTPDEYDLALTDERLVMLQ